MLQLMRLLAIGSVLMFVPARSPLAQESNPLSLEQQLPTFFSQSVIDEITEGPTQVVVRGTIRADNGWRARADWLLVCERTDRRRGVMIVQDRELKTDDRWGLESGTCDALLAAARQRKEAQGP
jgi:hypothetical protein